MPSITINLGPLDAGLIAAVCIQALVIAYLYPPRWKALVLILPVPFTIATLALNRPLDATNVFGLLLLLGYAHGIRFLHAVAGVPIVPAIAAAVLSYCAVATAVAPRVPPGDVTFYIAVAAVLAVAITVHTLTAHRVEPGHRTPLPVWAKLPIIVLVVGMIVLIKSALKGFMTTFPMVAVLTAYEARHSLWTICRQIPVLMVAMSLMMVTIRLLQGHLGLGGALAVGWGVYLGALLPYTRHQWSQQRRAGEPACK